MKPLTFIDIIDETKRTSSLATYGNRNADNHVLKVVGGLPHCTEFKPKTVEDAQKLIDWLNEWIKLQPKA